MDKENTSNKENKFSIITIDSSLQASFILRQLLEMSAILELIQQCHTGKEALDYCSKHLPDLILISRGVYDIADIDLLKSLLQICPSSKFIMASYSLDPEWVQEVILISYVLFINRTYSLNDILQIEKYASYKYNS